MMERDAQFWDNIAEKYSQQPIADEAAYQKKLKFTQALFTPDSEVLEIGCGTGSTALIHAPFVKHIRATDISNAMIEIAKAKAAGEGIGNITFEVASCDDTSAPDGSLDVVLAMSILHLLENRDEVIARVFRMLKPGGSFVSSTACLTGPMKILKLIIPVGALFGKMPTVVKFFSANELEKSLIDAGFAVNQVWHPEKGRAVFIVAKKPE